MTVAKAKSRNLGEHSMTVINTNTSSLVARDAIQRNDRAMSTAMERLSTGSRINSAKDDSAGLAVAERMSSTVGGLNMAVRNANDAISLLQTAEGATNEISNMLSRMRELAVQSASGTYTATDRAALDLEFGALMDEIDRIAANTKWNGSAILAGNGSLETALELANSKDIQLGADASQTMNLSFKSWRTKVAVDSNMTAADGTGRNGIDPVDKFIVDFGEASLTASQTLIIAGITITGTGTPSGADLASGFDELANGASGDSTNADINSASGTLTGFTTSTIANTDQVTFTAVTAGTALTIGGTGSGAATIIAGTGGTANNSAYRSTVSSVEAGILFYGSTPTRIDITSVANATQAITELDAAINGAAAEKAKLGSFMSRLTHAADNLQNISTNTSASLSRIADADYATETTELARTQIISQASTAMLAQANQVKQTVLSLLQ
jgi:flagellin